MPQKKNSSASRIIAIAALVIGAPLFCVVMYGYFAGFDVELQEVDRQRVLTVDDIELIDHETDRAKERLTRTRYIDGTWALEYEYDTDDVYVWCLTSHEHTERDARNVYLGQTAVGSLGILQEEGTELVDRGRWFSWGDQHESKVFMIDGLESGNLVNARKGNYVFGAVVSGVAYGEPEEFEEILVRAFERSISLD